MNIIAKAASAETKIKRSTFICNLAPVQSFDEAKAFISRIAAEHKTANHNCWAYILGKKADIYHSSDNGEPAGTAGKPILGTLQKHDLSNVVAVVTRYFGGVKLGVRGLIEAYGTSTELAINNAGIQELVTIYTGQLVTSYALAETLKYQLEKLGAKIENSKYDTHVKFYYTYAEPLAHPLETFIDEWQMAGKLENKKENPE